MARRVTIQMVDNSHSNTLALTFVLPDGSRYDVPGVNGGTSPETLFGYFHLEEMNVEFRDLTAGQTWTYPNPAHIRRDPISGPGYVGYRWSFDDAAGDGDFNDIVMDVKAYAGKKAPPCVQYPRDDSLGNSPRIYPPPKSQQGGNRQADGYY